MQHRETISIGDYIVERLSQLGVKAVFGVPGDFNLALLDKIDDHPEMDWVGCCNELNAAYAADGYSRVGQGLGVLVTTYGVGELSALNGVAGAFSERVPLLHIVGAPSTRTSASGRVVHHSLGDGEFDHFIQCTKPVTVAQEALKEAKGAGGRIDRVLLKALSQHRPAYLSIPMDLVPMQIPAQPLATPLTLSSIRALARAPPAANSEREAVDHISRLCKAARKTVVLVDVGAVRYQVLDLVREFLEETGLAFFTTIMAKACIDESHPQFRGVYVGMISEPKIKADFESADVVVAVGLTLTDMNTGGFSMKFPEHLVEIGPSRTTVAGSVYEDAKCYTILPLLGEQLRSEPILSMSTGSSTSLPAETNGVSDKALTQETFWKMATKILREGDVIVSEAGTCAFGLINHRMPRNTHILSQYIWCSIGWSVGASLGAAVAAKEQNRRCVVFAGDGSVQVTAQDISSMLRLGLTPVIFLINNDGYTIERLINGPERGYNDIQPWRWGQLLDTFGAKDGQASVHRVSSTVELRHLISSHDVSCKGKLTFVEVILGKMDAPQIITKSGRIWYSVAELTRFRQGLRDLAVHCQPSQDSRQTYVRFVRPPTLIVGV